MRYSIIGLVALGIVAACSAAILMAVLGQKSGPRPAAAKEQVTILIAARDMPSVTVIDQDAFSPSEVPANQAPAGYLTNPVQVLGRPLTRPVVAGQALTEACFASGRRGVDLVANLPEGKRAVTVELTHAAGLEGLLYPGSVVDVLASFDVDRRGGTGERMAVSTTLLHGVEVLAIDADTVSGESKGEVANLHQDSGVLRKSRRVTLLVDSDQAKALQLATEHGSVSLAMRNPLDHSKPQEDPTLLSGGRLAGLAEYLEGSVSESSPPAATAGEPAPRAEPAAQRWDITIMRGSEVEVRTMTRPDRLDATLAADGQR